MSIYNKNSKYYIERGNKMIRNIPLYSGAKYKLLMSQIQEMIIFFDHKGNIIDCNGVAKDLLGYEDDIYKISVTDIFRKVMKKNMNRVEVAAHYPYKPMETVAYRKNQTCMPVELKVSINDSKRGYIGICTAINITDKKNALKELKHVRNDLNIANKIKLESMANITHELKTPVNGIMGLTENLLDTELTPKQIEITNIIHRCCINMNSIINNFLDYAKMMNGRLILEKREFIFREIIDVIIASNIKNINNKGLKFLVNVADDIPERVVGDECRLSQIITNILSNAIKFTSVGQIVMEIVKTAQTEKEIELFFMIMDTGIGISLEERDKLFQSFIQVDGSITRRFGGTGLGLSISKQLIEAMKGTIAVDSEKNKGSTFSFTVRLGVSQEKENKHVKYKDKSPSLLKDKQNMKYNYPRAPKIDFLGKLLENANITFPKINDLKPQFCEEMEYKQTAPAVLYDTLEKLTICIEMESWMKAEEIAEYIKRIIPKGRKEIENKAFHLVLLVRKESHDKSLQTLKELKEMMERFHDGKHNI